MITTIGKCLAVATAAASLAFLGFAMISTYAGPNWQGEMEQLKDFTFEKSEGETPSWTVKWRLTGESVPLSGQEAQNPAAAVVAARRQLEQKQRERRDELQRQIRVTGEQINEAEELIRRDLQGVETRIERLKAALAEIERQIAARTEEGSKLADQVQAIENDTQQRVQEAFRLRAQLEELRTDKYRAEEQKKKLEGLLVLVRGSIKRLERRNAQLENETRRPYEETGVSSE